MDSTTATAVHQYQIPLSAQPERLDKVLAKLMPDHSRARLQEWIEQGHVLVNEQSVRQRHRVLPGDHIQVWPQRRLEELAYEPEPMSLTIVAHNEAWLVVNKPAGLVVHPGAGNWSGTLLNGLLHHYPQLAHVARAGIVHRLDKDTSGLMVVALTEVAQTHLVRQLQARSVERQYLALCHGRLAGEGCIDTAIGRDAHVPVRMSAQHPIAPKEARTHYQAIAHGQLDVGSGFRDVTVVQCQLETGRTHQIRVHLAHQGHPLLGDTLYGGKKIAGAQRQMLHAQALAFVDPVSEQIARFTTEPPSDFQHVYGAIQW